MGCSENEAKKEYLLEYREHIRRIGRIDAELEELRAMKTSISINNDGMPHGFNQDDMSGYVAKLDGLERRLLQEKNQRFLRYTEISDRLNSLTSENERDVLFYRYIKGLAWWEIAERMGYSERQIHRYHGNALFHLKL